MTAPITASGGDELLSCPFCGSGTVGFTYIRDGHSVCCMGCMASVHAFEPNAKAEAAKRWNTRSNSHATLKARIEELTDALDEILNYKGGANSALEDEYVMDRAILASKGGAK